MMETAKIICQVIIGLGILNVWILRFNRSTAYRGKQARNLKEEFETYGLPGWFIYLVGAIKIPAALALLAGVFFPVLVVPAASVMAILMLGAVIMHLKVADEPIKFLPASSVLLLSLFLIFA